MAPEGEKRRSAQSGQDDFEGRDLLVGRPEGAEARSATEPPKSASAPPTSPKTGAHDQAIGEVLAAVQAIGARLDTFHETPGPERETTAALARETAALTRAVADARGALSKATELAARQDKAADVAQVLAERAATVKAQGEALDQRIRATDRQSAVAAHSLEDMNQSAMNLNDQLRNLGNDLLRISDRLRWRHWQFGLAIGAASFVFFAIGLVLQRETDFVSFGDPRDAWNDHVEEHFTPTLAACTSRARELDEFVRCQMHVGPSRELTIPLYPGVGLTKVPPEEEFDGTTDR